MVESIVGKAKSGIWGLDDILAGGFTREHMFLIEGAPGTGKTTIALQFLMEGARAGEKCLYITLSETERELRLGAASHGWKLDERIEVYRVVAAGEPARLPSNSRACSIPPTSNWARPPSRSSPPSIARSRTG